MRHLAEAIVIGMACFAPWAFGSVEAWAEFALYAATAAVTTLVALAGGGSGCARRLLCAPSLAMAGLAALALIQLAPIPDGVFGWVAPGSAKLRAAVLPASPEAVAGDPGPTVPLPSPRLSQEPGETARMATRIAAGWLLFQGVLALPAGAGAIRRLGVAMAINASTLALFSILQSITWKGRIFWVGPETMGDAWSVGGPFVCHTHLAEYLNLGLGLALGLAIPGGWRGIFREKSYRPWAAYGACVMVAGIVSSNSRGGFLAMLASGAVMALALRTHIVGLGLGAVAILASSAVVLSALGDSSPYLARIVSIVDPGNGGYSARAGVWRGAVRAWWAFPVWGTGLGSFSAGSAPFLDGDHASYFVRAENEYLDILSEGGLVGLALLAVAVVGVVQLAWRASERAASARDRGPILGAGFGLIALGFNSLSDFGPHVPGVGVPALILAATLCRMGLEAGEAAESERISGRRAPKLGRGLVGLATVAASLGLASRAFGDLRAESYLRAVHLPLPGELSPSMDDLEQGGPRLERQRAALSAALRIRPDWADGQIRLGMIHLALYKLTAAEWLSDAGMGLEGQASDPLWLLGVVHDPERRRTAPIEAAALLEYDPVRDHLVPAARAFLEARRACPVSALAQAELASLDYLLIGGDPASAYLNRAYWLAGNRGGVLGFAADVAAKAGEVDLAARCWRRVLEVNPGSWDKVADSAPAVLSPDRILGEVIPGGKIAYQFATKLYEGPADRPTLLKFLRAAAAKLPEDAELPPAERLQLEARAWAGLDEAGPAAEKMEAALALKPANFEWRKDLIDWLLRWNRFEEAHDQARVGLYFAPQSKAAREALDRTTDALARKGAGP